MANTGWKEELRFESDGFDVVVARKASNGEAPVRHVTVLNKGKYTVGRFVQDADWAGTGGSKAVKELVAQARREIEQEKVGCALAAVPCIGAML